MPQFAVASDVHGELRTLNHVQWAPGGANPQVDLLLCGDIGCVADGSFHVELEKARPLYRSVYCVLGNHEYYNAKRLTVAEIEARAAAAARAADVVLLQRSSAVTPEGVRILGCTLWSDTLAAGHKERMDMAQLLRDYSRIWTWTEGDDADKAGTGSHATRVPRNMDLADSADWFQRDAAWLDAALDESEAPTVVMTHHAPLLALNPPHFGSSSLTAAFVSDAARLVRPPVLLWASGHTHGRMAVRQGSVLCLAHCCGYFPHEAAALGSLPYSPQPVMVDVVKRQAACLMRSSPSLAPRPATARNSDNDVDETLEFL